MTLAVFTHSISERQGRGEHRNTHLNWQLLNCCNSMCACIWLKSPPDTLSVLMGTPRAQHLPGSRAGMPGAQGASCRVPRAAQTPAKSLEKADLEAAFSQGITKVFRRWECLTSLRFPTALKLPMLDICISITAAELTVLGSTGAL